MSSEVGPKTPASSRPKLRFVLPSFARQTNDKPPTTGPALEEGRGIEPHTHFWAHTAFEAAPDTSDRVTFLIS